MYRILIIEDDRAIAETMQRQIALWGYEVRCVENFKDVLSEFTAFDPQLVLLYLPALLKILKRMFQLQLLVV